MKEGWIYLLIAVAMYLLGVFMGYSIYDNEDCEEISDKELERLANIVNTEIYETKTIYNWSCQLNTTCENGKQWIEDYDLDVSNWDENTYAPQQTAISVQTVGQTFKLDLEISEESGVYGRSYTYCSSEVINCFIVNEICNGGQII